MAARKAARRAVEPTAPKVETPRAKLLREAGAVRRPDPSQLTLAIDGNRSALMSRGPVPEYEVASDSGMLPMAPPSSPSSVITVNPRARNQARYARKNDSFIAGIIDQMAKIVVGSGPVPDCRDKTLARNWPLASREFDTTGKKSFGAMLRFVGYTGFLTDAESFFRIDFLQPDGVDERGYLTFRGTRTPVRLKAMTAEYCPDFYDSMVEPWEVPAVVVDGIGLDRSDLDRTLFYMLYRHHPNDSGLAPYSPYLAEPVTADRVCHLMVQGIAGARRGMNRMTPILVQAQQLSDYRESELKRKQINNALCFFIEESPDTSGEGNLAGEYDPETGQPIGRPGMDVDSLRSQVDISSCGVTKLPSGMKINMQQPKGTPETDSWFVDKCLQAFCAAWGLPSWLVTMDLEGLSDRVMKFAIEHFKLTVDAERELIEHQVLRKVWKAYVMGEWFAGRWKPAPGTTVDDYLDVEWDWPILHSAQVKDDLKVLMAARKERIISGGYITKRVLGKDPEQMAVEIAKEAARDQALGFAPEMDGVPAGQTPIPAWAPTTPEAKAILAAVTELLASTFDMSDPAPTPDLPELV